MIAIEGLSYRYRDGERHALQNVCLSMEPGEFVVVAGPSGCGKSTLALAITGILFRQFGGTAEGRVGVAGIDVRSRPVSDVAELVGLVQQNPENQFCTLTVQDEVAFGLENRCLPRDEICGQIDWALDMVGARHLRERALASLSGGEKQRVAIAAMMAARPRVIIFDEPTSSLDPTATADLFQVIASLRAQAGLLVIVIEHKLDYLVGFDPRLVAMDAGRIVYDGALAGGEWHRAVGRWQMADSRWGTADDSGREATGPAAGETMVRVEGLCAGYNGSAVLQGVSLEIGAGELVAVMGDNGSGKTTFLRSLMGLLKPQKGRVEVLGMDTRNTPVSRLARHVGFVFQNPDHQLFADTVWDEAVFAPRNFRRLDARTEARVTRLLEKCGLADRRADHPYQLSYGQKRRLNLASVQSYAPRLLLLDEVLIGQDRGNAAFVMELLWQTVRVGSTVIMVNHTPGLAQHYASRLLFFEGGRLLLDAATGAAFDRLRCLGKEAYVPRA